jgi:tRNA(fMet)-specific endonuclease VapC
MKTPGSLALDSSVIVRHMRTADPVISSRLKAATELYLPLTALGEMRFGIQRAGNSRRAVEQWERFAKEVVLLLPDDATATAYAELSEGAIALQLMRRLTHGNGR